LRLAVWKVFVQGSNQAEARIDFSQPMFEDAYEVGTFKVVNIELHPKSTRNFLDFSEWSMSLDHSLCLL